ncbi:alpha/beta hydrolase [Panacibacter ginsenosidivorans]|uniref:Alpha/beta hydrolase n=1 Tax=Panacibacter ginsenosidivorans TaxID=1813871 RepID=A0A5B8V5Y7_9BACT|nr:alpha/beta hydrolase [Panacibacter ginsenosidivorans]QEC66897.1 alpha/beta hydrolase [Panacibacter ginsenosidivorans]
MKRRQNLFWTIPLLFLFFSCKKELQVNDEGNLVPKTVVNDASLSSVTVSGAMFHAETFGDPKNKMLVILHGGPGNDYRYLLNCKAFANEGYYVVFYDQRGSGLSQRFSKDSYSIQLMLDDLGAVIAHYRTSAAQKVFLLGHSWGAILATAYVNKYPAAINGVVMGEPGGFTWQDIMDYVNRSQDYRLSSETLNDATYLDQFLTGSDKDQAILDYKLGLLSASDASPDSPIGNEGLLPYWRAGAVVNRALFDLGEKEKPDFTTNLHQFTTPVLFCYSERNKAYGQAYAQKVSSAYPNVQLEKINNAGHDFISFSAGWNNFFPIALTYLNSL